MAEIKPLVRYEDRADIFGDSTGGGVPAEVVDELQKVIASENSGTQEDNQLLEIAKIIPKDELMKLASKYAARRYVEAAMQGNSEDAGEEDENEAVKIALGSEKMVKISESKYKEPAEVSSADSESDKGGETNMKMNDAAKKVLAEIENPLRTMIADIVKKVVTPAPQTSVEMPKDTDKQQSPVLSDEAIDTANGTVAAEGKVKGEEKKKPVLVSKPADLEEVTKRSVDMPNTAMQEQVVLSSKKEAEGSSIDKVVQTKVAEPPAQSAVDMPKDTDKQKGSILSDEPVDRAGDNIPAEGSIMKASSKKEAEVATKVVPAPKQTGVDEPEDKAQEEATIGEIQESPLPGARKVTEPDKSPQLAAITAKFVPKRPLERSEWVVYRAGKPVFSVRLDQAFERENIRERWQDFVDPSYGELLVSEVEKKGIAPVLRENFSEQGKGGFAKYATLLFSADEIANPPEEKEPDESAVIDNDVQEKMREEEEAENTPLLKALPSALAVLFVGKGDEVDSFSDTLKDLVNDEELLGELIGEIKSIVKDFGPSEEPAEPEEVGAKITSAMKKVGDNKYLAKIMEYFNLIPKLRSEITSYQSEAKSRMQKVSALEKELQAYKTKEKTRKATVIALSMIKRGLLEDSKKAFDTKVAELKDKSDETLEEIAKTIVSVPVKKGRKEEGRKMAAVEAVPLTTCEKPIIQSYGDESEEEQLRGLFSTPPAIDERNALIHKKE